MEDIAHAINRLHGCVEDVGGKIDSVRRESQAGHTALIKKVGQVSERVAKIEGWQRGIGTAMGVKPWPVGDDDTGAKPKRVIGMLNQTKAFWAVAAAAAAGAGGYKLLVAVAETIHRTLLGLAT